MAVKFSTRELSYRWNMSPQWIIRKVKAGVLKAESYSIGNLYDLEEVEKFEKENNIKVVHPELPAR